MAQNNLTLGIAGAAFMLRRLAEMQVSTNHISSLPLPLLSKIVELDNALEDALNILSPDMDAESYLESAKTGLKQAIES